MLLPSALTDTLRVKKGDVLVNVYVVFNAAVTQITGLYTNATRVSIRLKLQATPDNDQANTALRAWLAHCLDVPHSKVTLVRGQHLAAQTTVSQQRSRQLVGFAVTSGQSL